MYFDPIFSQDVTPHDSMSDLIIDFIIYICRFSLKNTIFWLLHDKVKSLTIFLKFEQKQADSQVLKKL